LHRQGYRHGDFHCRPPGLVGQKAKFAAEQLRPRRHRLNPNATHLGGVILDTAIVLNDKQKPSCGTFNRNIDVRATTVTQGVRRGFLRNAVEIDCAFQRERAGDTLVHIDHEVWRVIKAPSLRITDYGECLLRLQCFTGIKRLPLWKKLRHPI
jgi:hypothetical protein